MIAGVMVSELSAQGLQRKEKVVLVVDLVESVAHMHAHEAGTIRCWQKFLAHVRDAILPQTGGRLVKSLGDGLMLEFEQPRPAIAACAAMHDWMQQHGAVDDVSTLRLRAGMHFATVYDDGLDIYGSGVNLAARIAGLATPGSTVVSEAVRARVADGLDAAIRDLGECYVKHLPQPVHIYSVGTAPEPVPQAAHAARSAAELRATVAVVPYAGEDGETSAETLGDVIADGLIARLGRTHELLVLSRLSTKSLRGLVDVVAHARVHLRADYVLLGRCVVRGSKLKVTSEFVEAITGEVLWADQLEATSSDIFDLDSEICRRIASSCHQMLLQTQAMNAVISPLPNLRSSSLLLGSVALMHRSNTAHFARAREALDALVDRHGRSALPRVWLAMWYVLSATRGLTRDTKRDAGLALTQTEIALSYEPGNAMAWAMQGFVQCHLRGDLDRALACCEEALRWNPNESFAWLFKAMVHAFEGDGARALPAGERALDLSPLDPLKYYYESLMASIAISAGRYDRAIFHARESLRLNAVHLSSYRALVLAQSLAGLDDEARQSMRALRTRDPHFSVDRFAERYPARERVPDYLERLKDAFRRAGAT
jgi:adenylate cyclase